MIEYITSLRPVEILIGFSALVFAAVVLLITIAIVFDKLNIKKFSIIPPCLEFYADGETKKSRVTGRKKTVHRSTHSRTAK